MNISLKDVAWDLMHMGCSVMGERNTFQWFGHIGEKKSEVYLKKVYVSDIEGPRGRQL